MGALCIAEGCLTYIKIASLRVDVTALQFAKIGLLRLTGSVTGGGFASFTPTGETESQESAATAWAFFLGPTIATVHDNLALSTSIGPYIGVLGGDQFPTTTTGGVQLKLNLAFDMSESIR